MSTTHSTHRIESFALSNKFQLKLLTPIDVARVYALHPHTVSKFLCGAIKMDLPKAFKVGGQWRFREDDVKSHIDRLSGRATKTEDKVEPLQPLSPRGRGRPRKVVPQRAGDSA